MTIIMSFMLMNSILFMMMKHPMSMGFTLMIQTMLMSIMTGMMMKTFWLSYMMIIVILSGLIVLFMYMSSMAWNEKFKTSMKMLMLFSTMLTVFLMDLFLFPKKKKKIIPDNYWVMEMSITWNMEMIYLSKMFFMNNMVMTLFIVIYLLYTMIVVTNMISNFEGPMRSKSMYVQTITKNPSINKNY